MERDNIKGNGMIIVQFPDGQKEVINKTDYSFMDKSARDGFLKILANNMSRNNLHDMGGLTCDLINVPIRFRTGKVIEKYGVCIPPNFELKSDVISQHTDDVIFKLAPMRECNTCVHNLKQCYKKCTNPSVLVLLQTIKTIQKIKS